MKSTWDATLKAKQWKSKYYRQYRLDHPEMFKRTVLKSRYKLTLEQYNELFSNQKGLCSGCYQHSSELKRGLFVDHCHKSNKVRGLLCSGCNKALGDIKDSPETLRRLADYLERNSK